RRRGVLPSSPPAFIQGELRGWPQRGGWLLLDHSSELLVSADGTSITGEVALDGAHESAFFAQRTLLGALVIALRSHGVFHVHAGSVVDPNGVSVVIVGTAGAGKSTTTVALVRQGFRYLSDDVLFVRLVDGEAR